MSFANYSIILVLEKVFKQDKAKVKESHSKDYRGLVTPTRLEALQATQPTRKCVIGLMTCATVLT